MRCFFKKVFFYCSCFFSLHFVYAASARLDSTKGPADLDVLTSKSSKEAAAEGISLQSIITSIYDNKRQAIVLVRCLCEKEAIQLGTGFFISDKGHLITSASVVEKAHRYFIEYKKIRHEAKLLGVDALTNVALLKLTSLPEQATYITLPENQKLPAIGTFLVSLTYKLALNVTPRIGLVTGHNVSYFEHSFPTTLARSTLPIDGGDSGGALFDLQENFVGMLVHPLNEIQETYMLPTSALSKACNDLLLFGKLRYGYLGMEVEVVLDQLTEKLCLQVINVHKNSPAAQAGIRPMDILRSLNDQQVETIEELTNFFFFTYPGQKVSVEVLRKEKSYKYKLEVVERPTVKIGQGLRDNSGVTSGTESISSQ